MSGSRNPRRFKAISEMISVIMLLGIALIAGYIIYRAFVLQTQQQQASAARAVELARERIAERFSLVAGYIRVVNESTKEVVLVIYNYGDIDVKFTKLYVPAIAKGGKLVILTYEINTTIKKGDIDTIRITINNPNINYPPGIIVRVSVMTSLNRIYTFNVRTIGGV